ncbi:ParB N-terminal domain-containing protein [Novosphingobium sp. G106]|uniref:ParB/RepB/Spo0J family partition protein n=1 Tax=Novosphingobium sp. G106 TaxID=2849500 RepID=UPI001C2CDE76|nr:ParB N-terminal domain-containing protein [Novosphingobium sp. G106]MBV1691402.1 ParB N-terminal domain-containing protein [Novosphingobium sp. G106]
MKLDFIDISKLSVSKANMRYAKKAPDVSDILPTVRRRGIIQPLIVRPVPNAGRAGPVEFVQSQDGQGSASDSGLFEILAGARRFHAARIVAEEKTGLAEALPCAILDEGDDAAAIEASLIENLARLDPDEVTQWETFTRLVREGRKPEDIAETFGLPDPMIRRILALGNLLPRIRDLYRAEQIDRNTVRHLTMASKSQQKAWLALHDDADAYVPTGHQLKAWLFGGQSIKASHALFDIAAAGCVVVSDLFGEDSYFADPDAFWTAQNAAVEARRGLYLEAGWSDVVIVGSSASGSERFHAWEYEKVAKRKGGRIYIEVRPSGEVTFHEGYLSRKEARRAQQGGGKGAGETGGESESAFKAPRGEITQAMQIYLDLHRHAAVRAAMTGHPGLALRLLVAHAICGTHLFRVTPEPQTTRNEAVRESVETAPAEARFDEKRRAMLDLLAFDPDTPTLCGGNGGTFASGAGYGGDLVGLFLRLLELPDMAVMDLVAVVMGEALASGSPAIEAVGIELGVDMAGYWQADPAFFELIRDREVLGRIVADLAGETVAAANAGEKTKTLKRIAAEHLAGEGGRAKVEGWVPRWMAFPPSAYTARGGVGTVSAHGVLEAARQASAASENEAVGDPSIAEVDERFAA